MAGRSYSKKDKSLEGLMGLELSPLRAELQYALSTPTKLYAPMVSAKEPEQQEEARARLDEAGQHFFDKAALDNFLKSVEKVVTDDPYQDTEAFKREKAKVDTAISTGDIHAAPAISKPAHQLIWAAAMGHLATNPSTQDAWPEENKFVDIADSKPWKSITQSDYARGEYVNLAYTINEDVADKSTRLRWGNPGSMFSSNHEDSVINIDLITALTTGMEHAVSGVHHQIAHSTLSADASPPMQEIFGAIAQQNAHIKNGNKLTQEEYIEREQMACELGLREALFNSGEDNALNNHVAKKPATIDYGYSLNAMQAMIAGTGYRASHIADASMSPADDHTISGLHTNPAAINTQGFSQEALAAKQQFDTITHTVQMAFFTENGLIANTPESWEAIGINPQLIQEDPNYANATGQNSDEAFQHLLSLCKDMQQQLPTRSDALAGPTKLAEATSEKFDARMQIQEEIWERYLKQHADIILDAVAERAKQDLDNSKDNDQSKDSQDTDGPPQQGDQKKDDAQNQKAEDADKQKGGQQQGGEQPDQQSDNQPGDGDNKQDGNDTDSTPQQGQSNSPAGSGTVPVEGHGDMDDSAADVNQDQQQKDGQSPADEQNKDGEEQPPKDGEDEKNGKDSDGKGEDNAKDGQTIEDIIREEEERKKREEDKKQQQTNDATKPDSSDRGGRSFNLNNLPTGDWTDYESAKRLCNGPILQVTGQLRDLRDKKTTLQKTDRTLGHDLVPEDGDLSRFDVEKHKRLLEKQLLKEKLKLDDYNKFKRDAIEPQPAPYDIVLAADLSGSMATGEAPNRPIDAVMQMACIIREAGKAVGDDGKPPINVYVCGWGDESGPRWVVTPEMSNQEVGEKIAGIKKSAGGGTSLAPAFLPSSKRSKRTDKDNPSIIDMLRDTGPSSDTMVGNTHITVVSDGDLGDTEQSKVVLSKFLKTCPNASLDFAIINDKKVTDMEIMAKGLEQRHGNSVSVATTKEQECTGTKSTTGDAQRMMLSTLTNRIQQSIVAPAIPQGVKMTHYDRFTTAFSVERGGLEVNER